ncbi:unnamed protein product [Clonostachys solani]|uniref:Uncharacterized protein n=1 Tax=Clonostachys solani TaxID=160281 RepID=A0A9P0EG45_9HYPO|nr:unnamed protein product [Clonostachys solani]
MESLPLRGTEASVYIIPEPDFSIDPDAPGSQWPDVELPLGYYQAFVDEEEEEELEEEEEEVNLDEIWAAADVDFEAAEALARLSLRVHLYSHLPSSTINRSLEGDFTTPLSRCSRIKRRLITFYRSLTPTGLQTTKTIAAPFRGKKNLIDFADI